MKLHFRNTYNANISVISHMILTNTSLNILWLTERDIPVMKFNYGHFYQNILYCIKNLKIYLAESIWKVNYTVKCMHLSLSFPPSLWSSCVCFRFLWHINFKYIRTLDIYHHWAYRKYLKSVTWYIDRILSCSMYWN